jgi:type I restriction enzyme S subunit
MTNEYKDSHLGKIPYNWKVVQLEEVCISKQGMRRGPFGGAIKKAFFVDKGYQVYEQRNAIYDDFEKVRYFINEDKYKELKAFQVEADDFIVSCSGTIGKIARVPTNFKKGVINQALLRIRLDRKIITDDYFLQQFRSKPFQSKITDSTQGGAMKNMVGMSEFRKTLITLPPLPEQQKIAEILSTVDAKIEVIDQQITETQELKKGLMQRLLTKGIGHTEFKDSPLGRIPKVWEVVKISKIADVTAGGTPSTKNSTYWGGDIPWMNSGDINLRRIKKVDGRITLLGLENSSTKLVPANSILMALAGQGKTRGKVAVNEFSLCTNQSLATIYNFKNADYEFLFQNLESRYSEIRKMSTGDGGRGGLNLAIIKSIPIALPPLKEQKRISEILYSFDEKLETLSEKKTNYLELKKGLMQQLLTGKVRVNTI